MISVINSNVYLNKSFFINNNCDCNDKNVIYIIICLKLVKYMLEAQDKFKIRCCSIFMILKITMMVVLQHHYNGNCCCTIKMVHKSITFCIRVLKKLIYINILLKRSFIMETRNILAEKLLKFDNEMNDLVDIHTNNIEDVLKIN